MRQSPPEPRTQSQAAEPPRFISRKTAKYIGFLALAIVTFHWKTLLTDQFTMIVGTEGLNQTYSWLHTWVRSLWSGHIPFWDPNAFGGRPFTEEMAAFYPAHLLFALIPLNKNGVISPHLYHEYIAFNRFLGAIFMFALLRELRRSHFAAFLGACAFSMGGLLGRLPWPQYMEACIWLPAILVFVLRSLRSQHRRGAMVNAAFAGACLGLSALTGGAQFSMLQGIFVLGVVLYHGRAPDTWPQGRWLRFSALIGIFLLTAVGMGAAQLLPSIQYAHLSLRSISGGWLALSQKIPYSRLVSGMWPGSIVTGLVPAGAREGGDEVWPYYVGVFPFFLAVTAMWRCWRNPWVRFLTVCSVIVFAITLGEFSPLFGVLYAAVPYLWMIRGASRFVYLLSFSIALLSAFGFDRISAASDEPGEWAPALQVLKWISLACIVAIVVPVIFTQVTLGIWSCLSLLLILGSSACFFRIIQRPPQPALRAAIALFVLFDLGAFNWLAANKDDLAKTGDIYVQALSMRSAAKFIKDQPGLKRVSASAGTDQQPNIGDIFGLQWIWGGGATVLKDYSPLFPDQDLMNVRYRIEPSSTPDPGAVYQDRLWKVYENRKAFPRAWMVHRTVLALSDEAAVALVDRASTDLRQVGIVESPLSFPGGGAADDFVSFQEYKAEGMKLLVRTSSPGMLILSEVYYPGWRAAVNGKSVSVIRVDGGIRGIPLASGESRVEMEYVPVIAWMGVMATLLTTLVCAWFAFRAWRWARQC